MVMQGKKYDKILVHCPSWVGDLVMATPALRTIRENNSSAHIALLVRPQVREVIEGLPYYDEIIDYDSKSLHRKWKEKFFLSRKLKKSRFSLSLILPNSFSSAALSFLAGIPARIGFNTNARGFMLTHRIPPPAEKGKKFPISMVERYLMICKELHYTISSHKTILCFSPGTREAVNKLYHQREINRNKPLVTFIPGASFGASKCWPPEYFAQVGDYLTEKHDAQILIVPGPREQEIACRIKSLMRHRSFTFAREIISLEYLKAIIGDSALVVTNDTGPRHFAVALNIPVVVVMGPTDPRYSNYSLEKTRLLREELECSPCHLKVCPTDHRCMRNISAEKVLMACEEFLSIKRK
ncbi:MAG TPA: lipopolysaccharide heptosyltransferase II [Thermodesulfobacteriota bacterium]|nr:lipopolysaccharide heptosyltransferase II [Thermodesulfobacteriota bacterium]